MASAGEAKGAQELDQPGFAASLGAFVTSFAGYARGDLALAAALLAVGAAVDGLGLALLIPLLGVIAPTTPTGGLRRLAEPLFRLVGADTPLARLTVLLAAYGALMLIRLVVTIWRDVKLARLQMGFLEAQRGEIADLLASAPWARLARLRHARITHLMSGDLQRISAGVNFLLQTSVSAAMLTAQCALAFLLSPPLAAIALGLLLATGLAVAPLVGRSRRVGRYVTEANLSLLDTAGQFLGALKLAISQNLQASFTREFRLTLRALTTRLVDNVRQRALARGAVTLLSAVVSGVVVFVGFALLGTPAPVLITLLLVISRMSGPVGQIQQGLQQIAFALPAFEKVAELKRDLVSAAEAAPAVATEAFPEGTIVFEGVSFEHPSQGDDPGARGVRDLDLTIAPGSFVGVTGPSGAGKTTFADLLVGLLAPRGGRITVGGRPLGGATLKAWREGVAYVSQDAFLFHDSVRRNLDWARPGADEAEMWRALALAGAEDLVRRMDEGLDTVVGERGILVSGGERQRIALARAILRQPRLLVLDEATNAIDLAAERALIERLLASAPRPTIVMIAHRPESLAMCQTRLWLEHGKLASEHNPATTRRQGLRKPVGRDNDFGRPTATR